MELTLKVYFGILWGVICVAIFTLNPIAGILGPPVYVVYLFVDTKISNYRSFVNRVLDKLGRKDRS